MQAKMVVIDPLSFFYFRIDMLGTMAKRRPIRVKDIAARVVKVKQKAKPVDKPRSVRKDVKNPKRKDVTLRPEELTRRGRLTRSSFSQLKEDFPDQNLKRNVVGRQLK